jgi:hypothetical protein
MKTLLLVPKRYSLNHTFSEFFGLLGAEIHTVELSDATKKWESLLHSQIFRTPEKWRLKWENYYFKKVNAHYLERFRQIKPDVVFVYNSELLLPETVEEFKRRGAKISFFLGDSPFYTHINRYFLPLLFMSDATFVPDSFWIHQLKKTGVKNLHFFQTEIPHTDYYPKQLAPETYAALKSEVLYIGMCYTDSWGYKKARFLSHFTGFDLNIHGNRHWKRWFSFFPELAACFHERDAYIPVERMNDMYNATKIIPVDGNPGLLHGPHLRIWEALGAGALPLMEWQHDLVEIFGENADIPAVKTYDEIGEIAAYYLHHEEARQEKIAWMKSVISRKYSRRNCADQIAEALRLNVRAETT